MDGFEKYATSITRFLLEWPACGNGATVDQAGRFGGYSLRENGGGSGNFISRYFTALSTFIHQFNFKTSAGTGLIWYYREAGTSHLLVELTAANKIIVKRGDGTTLATGTTTITNATWFYLQIKAKIHDTTGSVQIKVNGTDEINISGVDTRNGATGVVDNIWMGESSQREYDDMVFMDTSGSSLNDFLLERRIETLLVDGAGATTQWTPSAGANFENVDDPISGIDDDTTYNKSSTTGQKDTFSFGNLSGIAGTISAVQVNMVTRKDDAGLHSVKPVVRHSGTDYDGTEVFLPEQYVYKRQVYTTNPGTSAAWTVANVNAAQFGYKLIS